MNTLPTAPRPNPAMTEAHAYASAKMIPAAFRNSPGDCLIAIRMAERYGMDPFMLMLEMYIISGRPMLSGKLTAAICNHSLAEPLTPEYSGPEFSDDRKVKITGRAEGCEPRSIELTVRQAKTNNEQWIKNPDQMLMYAGSRVWARRYTPASMLGIVFDDEEMPKAHSPGAFGAATEVAVSTVAEATPHEAPRVVEQIGGDTWQSWSDRFLTCIRTASFLSEAAMWWEMNKATLARLHKEDPSLFEMLRDEVDVVKDRLHEEGEDIHGVG